MKIGSLLDIKPILKAYRGDTFPLEKHMGFEGALARLFDIALGDVKRGRLRTKLVAMSYAGNPDVVRQYKAYGEFVKACDKAGVETMLSVMSTTAGLNVGPGAFSLGYIGD
jgi:fatty acid-binding protein DegV